MHYHTLDLWTQNIWNVIIVKVMSGCILTVPSLCTLLDTSLLLSQACCKLPKYLPRSCQHLSVQQLERLWCISSMSFRPWPEHPFPWRAEGIKKKNKASYSLPICDVRCLVKVAWKVCAWQMIILQEGNGTEKKLFLKWPMQQRCYRILWSILGHKDLFVEIVKKK